MVMGGASIKTQSSNIVENQAALTISQLIRFNSVVRPCKLTNYFSHKVSQDSITNVFGSPGTCGNKGKRLS